MDRALTSGSPDGKYRLLAELGAGGMADVYLALAVGPLRFHKLVVLKVMKQGLAADTELVDMFTSEARLAARLNHVNVIQTYEVTEIAGRNVMVMEYLEGQTLERVVHAGRDGSFGRDLQIRVLADTLAGLHYAHELTDFDGTPLHLVHRDVSPQNIFVTFDGTVKVLDFGIAKAANFSQKSTSSGVLKGKVRYMAPEHVNGEDVDRRADIFCLGLMLWEAATGQVPWGSSHHGHIMYRISRGDLPRAKEANPNVPARLDEICSKALTFRREDRYPTAAAMQSDLEDFLQESGSRVTSRSVAAAMGTLFKAEKEKTRGLIEARIAEVSALSSAEHEARYSMGNVALLDTSSPAQRTDSTRSAPLTSAVSKRVDAMPRSTRQRAALGLGLLLVSTLVTVALQWRRDSIRAGGPSASPAPPAADIARSAPATTVESARVATPTPSTTPDAANVAIESVTSPPLAASVPRPETATRDGARAAPQTPRGAVDGGAKGPPAGAPTPRVRTSPASPPEPTCNPPFYYDEEGYKRPKPECL
jgi:serine/threonine-protein kinase